MKNHEPKEVSKQLLGQIRNKIEKFKRKQRKNGIHTKLYIDTNKALEIYQTIDLVQLLRPHQAVKKLDVALRKPKFSDRQIRRGLELLRRLDVLKSLEDGYWIPKYLKKNLKYQRQENERKDKIIEEQKRTQKLLLDENVATLEMAKPYLDNLIYCDTDEDWELLSKWFMKMQENKHYQKEAKSWEQTEKENSEITKEHPIPEITDVEKVKAKKKLKAE